MTRGCDRGADPRETKLLAWENREATVSWFPSQNRRARKWSEILLPLLRAQDDRIFRALVGIFVRSSSDAGPIVKRPRICSTNNVQKQMASQEKLEILQATDNHRRWYSLDDKRVCVICERTISGRQIEIRGRPGSRTLHCPTAGCPSNFSHWFVYQEPKTGADKEPPESQRSEFSFLPIPD